MTAACSLCGQIFQARGAVVVGLSEAQTQALMEQTYERLALAVMEHLSGAHAGHSAALDVLGAASLAGLSCAMRYAMSTDAEVQRFRDSAALRLARAFTPLPLAPSPSPDGDVPLG